MKNLFLFLFYIILCFNGCIKNPTEILTPDYPKVKKIIESSDNYIEFSYGDGLLIKKEDKSSNGFVSWSTSYEYDENNRITGKDVFSPLPRGLFISHSTYEYSADNRIQKENIYGRTNILNTYILYEYEKNKIIKYSDYSADDYLWGYHILKYEDGNIIEDAYYYNTDSLLFLETYEYDNNQNPLNVDKSPISASTYSRNNITRSIEIYYTSTPHEIYTTVNSYTYNNYGYPVKCFVDYTKNVNGVISQNTSTMFYEYEE